MFRVSCVSCSDYYTALETLYHPSESSASFLTQPLKKATLASMASQIIGINWSSPTTQIIALVVGGYLTYRYLPVLLPGSSVAHQETKPVASSILELQKDAPQRTAKATTGMTPLHLLVNE